MSQTVQEFNPFMLMLNPEVVIAAMEKSERLGQLNRQLCRPLDRQTATPGTHPGEGTGVDDGDGDGEESQAV